MTLEERIGILELGCAGIAGTVIQRIVTDREFCQRHSVTVPMYATPNQTIWCLALGGMNEPKAFFYGATIREAVSNAEKEMKK